MDPFGVPSDAVVYGNRLAAVYDLLVETSPGTGATVPRLAQSLVPSADFREWVVKLRPGVRFSDGTPFDAAAVKKTWDMHGRPEVRSVHAVAVQGLRTVVRDPLTLVATLDMPNANFDRMISRHLNFIGSPAALANLEAFRSRPVGAGPFVLTEWVKNDRQVLVRNPTYWQGPAPLDGLVYRVVPETEWHPDMIADGEANVSVINSARVAEHARRRGLGTSRVPVSGGQMLIFNTTRAPFDDPRVRRAVALALSTKAVNDVAFGGAGTPARGIFTTASPLTNINLIAPDNDPDEARRLFAELTAGGAKPVEATLLVPPVAETEAIAEYVATTLNAYPGVRITTQRTSVEELVDKVRVRQDYQMSFYQVWADDPDPLIYGFLHSASAGNVTRYSSREVDAALEAGRAASTVDARRTAYTRVQVQMNSDVPCWVYAESESVGLWGDNVRGARMFNDGVVDLFQLGLA
ncbi:ABC transporter substrate-binding protein [Yinghuangia sp. ASG 101]|uniref:ABC transporter substrate-binding protein n=1 Tax=Yinghuangia sp. ASG 101 TaxID=2896848 RepID=UPI001E33AF69|nr:ABC transporter substrate-binding protein [Yinghuangia sp. ASG 101]UGQ11193.1 ABC transporter substrate-binding protein [Yinghuangia sp. ASG 101]